MGSLNYAPGRLSFQDEQRQREVHASGIQADIIHMQLQGLSPERAERYLQNMASSLSMDARRSPAQT